MLGTRGCRLGILYPEIYEMQVEAIMRAAAAMDEPPHLEIMIPLVDYEHELEILRELVVRIGDEHGLQRARGLHGRDDDRAAAGVLHRQPDRRARRLLLVRHQRPHADRARASRATTSSPSSSRSTWSARSSTARRSRRSTSPGVGWLVRLAAWVGPRGASGAQARDLRRARRRPGVDRLLPHGRARLRLLLAVPRADRPRGGRTGGDRARVRRPRRCRLASGHVERELACRPCSCRRRRQSTPTGSAATDLSSSMAIPDALRRTSS